MNKDKLHLVPQAVIDCVEGMVNKNNNYNTRMNFLNRVEAIKDYCTTALYLQNINNKS